MTGILTAATTVDYGTMLGGMKDEALSGVNASLPMGLSIAGVLLAIGLGYKLFKRFAK